MTPDAKGALAALTLLLIVFLLGALVGFSLDHINIDWH